MDPLTQGTIGSLGASQISNRKHFGLAAILGFLSGMAPDLDIFIKSETDPLLALEFHRQFTHSLFFIPIGGLLCAVVFYAFFARKRISFKQTFMFCSLGYATHSLLDACTTYGTMLFWPISDVRIAWNNISIIDPLFTLPILFLILINLRFRHSVWVRVALIWGLCYLGLGVVQRERAEVAGRLLAQQRGITEFEVEAKPSFANIIVWKLVTSSADRYYVDAVRVGLFNNRVYEGETVNKLALEQDFPWLDLQSQQALDVERFRWFSNGYLAVSPSDRNVIIDMRYSMLPNEINGLWGIRLDSEASSDQHIVYEQMTDRDSTVFATLWMMITGKNIE